MELRKTLSSLVLAAMLLTEVQAGVLPVFQPIIETSQAATNPLGTPFNTPNSVDSQTDANGSPVSRPAGGTLNCPPGQIVTSVAYLGIEPADDPTDGLTIACSSINPDGTLSAPNAYLSNGDIDSNSRRGTDLVQPVCGGNSAVRKVYFDDLGPNELQNPDALDGIGTGCYPVSCDGIGDTEVETHIPNDIVAHTNGSYNQVAVPMNELVCPSGTVAVGVTYDSFGSSVSGYADAMDSVVRLRCAPVSNAFCPLPTADVTIQKSGPSTIQRGNVLSYSLNAFNAGPANASNVVVTDPIPAGLTFNQGQSSGNCSQNGANIVCSGFDLAPGQSSQLTLAFDVPTIANNCAQTTVQNRASIATTTPESNSSNNQSQTVSTTVTCPAIQADLSITKSGPNSVLRGTTASYQLNVFNAGPATANSIVVTDHIPTGLTFNAGQSSPNCNQNGANILCNNFNLNAGQNNSFTITFDTPTIANNCTQAIVTNTASIASATTDPNSSNNQSQTINTTLTCPPIVYVCSDGLDNDGDGLIDFPQDPGCSSPTDNDEFNAVQADLSITKSGPNSVLRGSVASYQLNVFNAGPTTANSVVITDAIPAGLTWNSSQTSSGCNQNGSNIVCNTGNLSAGQSLTIQIGFNVPTINNNCTQTTVNNTANVTSSTTDPNSANNQSQTVQTLLLCPDPISDLSIVKSTTQASVQYGAQITYILNVMNNGPATASPVTVTDTLPSGFTYISASGASCTPNAGQVQCTIPTLTSGQSLPITMTLQALPPPGGQCVGTTAVNSASVNGGNIFIDPNTANNTSSVTTPVTCPAPLGADLSIQKSGPNTVMQGSVVHYVITILNAGPGTATNVTIADPIPAGLTFNATESPSNCIQNDSNILCNSLTLTNGQNVSIALALNVPSNYACNGVIHNQASVSTSATDPNSGNNMSQNVSTTVTCPVQQADLSITKSGPAQIAQGTSTITYSLIATNFGPSAATNVVIHDPIPQNLQYASASGAPCSVVGNELQCIVASIPSGQSSGLISVTFLVPPPAPTCVQYTVTNTANVTSAVTDPNTNNNSSTAQTTMTCSSPLTADLSITKTGPSTIAQGATIQYTLVATNAGPGTATNVTIADLIPSGLTFNAAQSSNNCVQNGSSILCDNLTLTSGQSATILIGFNVPANAACNMLIQNQASVSTSVTDPNSGNNQSQIVNTTVTCAQTDLAITKQGPPPTIRGQTISYNLTVTNLGPSTTPANIVVTDPIPVGQNLTFNQAASSAGCIQNGTNIVCSDTLGAGSSRNFIVSFNVPSVTDCTTSTIQNTATASSQITDPNLSNNTSNTVSTTLLCPNVQDLAITKTGTSNAVRGNAVVYSLVASNIGTGAATGVIVTDPIPSELTYVSFGAPTGVTCGVVNTTNVQCTVGTLAQNSSITITLNFTAKTVTPCTQNATVTNTASVQSSTTDANLTNNSSSAVTTLTCPTTQIADMQVVLSGPSAVNRGTNAVYTAAITNNGPNTAQSASVQIPIPAGLTYVSSSGATCTLGGSTLTCALGDMAIGQNVSAVLTFSVPTIASCTTQTTQASATVTSTTSDSNAANNTSQVTTTLNCTDTTDLSVTKTDNRSTANVNDTLHYTITITNNGNASAANVSATDSVPYGLTILTVSDGASISGQNVTWNNLTIAAHSSRTISVDAQVRSDTTDGTVLRNTVSVNGQSATDNTTIDNPVYQPRQQHPYQPPYYPPYQPPYFPPTYTPTTPPVFYPPVVTPQQPTYYPPIVLPQTGTNDGNFYANPTDKTQVTAVKPDTKNESDDNGFGAIFYATLLTILAAGSAAASKFLSLGGL